MMIYDSKFYGILALGTSISLNVYLYLKLREKSKKSEKLHKIIETETLDTMIATDDDCNSLFYSKSIGEEGRGFPIVKTIDSSTVTMLKSTHREYKKISLDIYKSVVENMIIVCVDIVCQRKSDGKFLLFYRRDAPAANIWWWPGGRMFRGETFFDTTIRKIRDETGDVSAQVIPKGVINVWNTFFPDSNWDHDRKPGYEGTQTVNITIACDLIDTDKELDFDTQANSTWAVEAHRWVSIPEGLQVGNYDKYVRLNLEMAVKQGLVYY